MATMNSFQDLLDRQKRHFATRVTRSYAWRIEQLDRMAQLVAENETELQRAIAQDFKTASQEQIFETLACLGEVAFQKSQLEAWMKPVEAPVPRALAATGHRGVVYRDPLWRGVDNRSLQWPAPIAAPPCDHGACGGQLLRAQAE
jgi:acyl-CoA reductase-like NAD-dependent aldehyde dehydrogenase